MKTEKLFLVLFALLLFSCKKEINTGPQNNAVLTPQYSIENNYLNFKTTKDYVSVAGDLQSQNILSGNLGKSHFRNMASINKQVMSAPDVSSVMTPSYPDSTDEDPDDLYPEYLQEILNDDSIVNIGNYLIKIDLVNDKGLAIEKSLPEAYEILKNSDPNNLYPDSDVMLFGEDEDVLDVLDWIASGEGTYKKYLDEMSGFSVPIFCHDKGAPKKKDKRVDYYDPGNHRVRFKTELTYQKAIIYFRLHAEGKAQRKRGFIWFSDNNTSLYLSYKDRWVQRCKRQSQPGEGGSLAWVSGPKVHYVAYSGAKSLRQYEMYSQFSIKNVDWPFYQYFTTDPVHYIMYGY